MEAVKGGPFMKTKAVYDSASGGNKARTQFTRYHRCGRQTLLSTTVSPSKALRWAAPLKLSCSMVLLLAAACSRLQCARPELREGLVGRPPLQAAHAKLISNQQSA